MEQRKQELKREATHRLAQESAAQQFRDTLKIFVTTLRETFPDQTFPFDESKDMDAGRWYRQFKAHEDMLRAKNPQLMLAPISVLKKLCVPQLWIQERFTVSSKGTLWDYLLQLFEFAAASVATPEPAPAPFLNPVTMPSSSSGLCPSSCGPAGQMPPNFAQLMSFMPSDSPGDLPESITQLMKMLPGNLGPKIMQMTQERLTKNGPTGFDELRKLSSEIVADVVQEVSQNPSLFQQQRLDDSP